MIENEYIQFIAEVKQRILQSRYKAASLANREMLLLYYETGKRLSEKIKSAKWGAKIIRSIADDLQKELPGLRGFSFSNLKNMRQFYDEYFFVDEIIKIAENKDNTISQLVTGKIGQLSTAQFYESGFLPLIAAQSETSDNIQSAINFLDNVFLKIGFTHHILLINKCKDLKERLYY